MYLEIGREVEFVFDFRNATTELVIKHWNYRKREILEAIQRNNPFANQDRANILFPLGTAWWTLPLINLTKITFEHWNGKEKERLNFEWIKIPSFNPQFDEVYEVFSALTTNNPSISEGLFVIIFVLGEHPQMIKRINILDI